MLYTIRESKVLVAPSSCVFGISRSLFHHWDGGFSLYECLNSALLAYMTPTNRTLKPHWLIQCMQVYFYIQHWRCSRCTWEWCSCFKWDINWPYAADRTLQAIAIPPSHGRQAITIRSTRRNCICLISRRWRDRWNVSCSRSVGSQCVFP